MTRDGSVPVLSQTRSDQAGKFHFPRPAPEKLASVDTTLTLWAHKPGLGLGVVDLLRNDRRAQVHRIVLEATGTAPADHSRCRWKADRGARVAPRIVQTEQTSYLGVTVPDDWLERFSALTDERGIAALPSLSRKIDLRSARVSVPGRGTHVLMLPYSKGKEDVTLALSRAGGLETRVNDASGAPVAGAQVELWVRSGVPLDDGRLFYLTPERLRLRRMRLAPDQTAHSRHLAGCSWARPIGWLSGPRGSRRWCRAGSPPTSKRQCFPPSSLRSCERSKARSSIDRGTRLRECRSSSRDAIRPSRPTSPAGSGLKTPGRGGPSCWRGKRGSGSMGS